MRCDVRDQLVLLLSFLGTFSLFHYHTLHMQFFSCLKCPPLPLPCCSNRPIPLILSDSVIVPSWVIRRVCPDIGSVCLWRPSLDFLSSLLFVILTHYSLLQSVKYASITASLLIQVSLSMPNSQWRTGHTGVIRAMPGGPVCWSKKWAAGLGKNNSWIIVTKNSC